MIRNIVLLRLHASATAAQVDAVRAELSALSSPGLVNFSMGHDLALREGNMDVGIVVDFADADAYRAYDADPEHNRIRRELIAPIAERVERCQLEL